MPDPRDGLRATRDAPVGGQAVLEGVMMRGVSTWAVALRTPAPDDDPAPGTVPTGPIAVQQFPLSSLLARHRLLRLPVVRGIVALGESLRIGFRGLQLATEAQAARRGDEIGRGAWALAVVLGVVLALGLFFVVPVALAGLVEDLLGSAWLFWVVEGVLRTAIFIGYLVLVSRQRDLRRLFEYHGAEHQVIACYEAGRPLEPAEAARFSRLHPRCGTSFLLVVMLVSVFVLAPLGMLPWGWLIATRILAVPLIAGIAFELIKAAGRRRRHGLVRAVMWPGLQLQRLTTRTPDAAQLAVACAALSAVLAVEDPLGATDAERVGMEVVA